jgi:hypothetical protein
VSADARWSTATARPPEQRIGPVRQDRRAAGRDGHGGHPGRTRHPAADPTTASTTGWERDAWPVKLGDGTWVLHCVARPPEGGEWTGSKFRSGP